MYAILVIASKNTPRELMLIEFWQRIIQKYADITEINTYLLFNDEHLTSDYTIGNNVITFKDRETVIPGILNKTMKAFEILKDQYDLFFRTNLSSYVHYPKILSVFNELKQHKYVYGGIKNRMRKFFFSGAGFFISKDVIKDFLLKENLINYHEIDDQSIGLALMKNYHQIFLYIGQRKDYSSKINKLDDNYYHYRLKKDYSHECHNFNYLLRNLLS